MFTLKHRLMAAAVDIFQPAAAGGSITALQASDTVTDTEQAAQDGLIAGLQTSKADKTELHTHTNQALLDAFAGHGDLTLAGRNLTFTKTDGTPDTTIDLGSDSANWNSTTNVLTITHIDGSTTVATIPSPTVLSATVPPTYNDTTKEVTFTWSDNSVTKMDVSALFDDTAFSGIAKNDGARTLTMTRLNGSTTVVDLSPWFPTLLTLAQAVDGSNTDEGLINGSVLDDVINTLVPINANVTDTTALAAINTTAFKGRERQYLTNTKQLALWTTAGGGDVTPTVGGGSWWLVGSDSTAITSAQTAITNLQTNKADKTELHAHANKALLDSVSGVGDIALAGRNLTLTRVDGTNGTPVDLGSDSAVWNAPTNTLTITHVDGTQTVAAIPAGGTVLDVNTPPAYNDATNVLTLTWSDASTTDISLNDLFDANAISQVTKTDASKTLTFTQLNAGVIALDISSWFPSLLTVAEVIDKTSVVEGIISGERLDAFRKNREQLNPIAGGAIPLEWGKRYLLQKNESYVFPTPTANISENWIECYPADGSWQDFDPALRWNGQGAVTIGTGQVDSISTNYGQLLFYGETATNIRVFG